MIKIRGVGPYTSQLAVNLTFGGGVGHVDSYVAAVISTFYFAGARLGEAAVEEFIRDRWGDDGEYVVDLLTTDSEQWCCHLGVAALSVRSGARV
jgi:hypothetical protein